LDGTNGLLVCANDILGKNINTVKKNIESVREVGLEVRQGKGKGKVIPVL
jgi:biotin operon repressor